MIYWGFQNFTKVERSGLGYPVWIWTRRPGLMGISEAWKINIDVSDSAAGYLIELIFSTARYVRVHEGFHLFDI